MLQNRITMNIKNFVVESIDEMKNKVTWPPYSFLQNSAVLVIVASLVFALVIGLIDLGFENLMTWFYDLF
ncbi:preprotein translocase subunit SecE [Rhodonellum ikkaensis]|uniref:Protein translocase subunit SecE n=2 Tax=Cytophagaceae TaxID=89373 RepID=A0A1H3MC51_9BACT|nr:preprotein translocase subunit SecE [Rhodonellum ikkaensis]